MPLGMVPEVDFAFGELSDEYAASDSAAKARSLKKGRNLRILNSYGWSNRSGSRWLATLSGVGVAAELMTTLGDSLIGIIRAGGIDVYSASGGLLQSIGGAPWSASEAQHVVWHVRADELYVTHQSYWPRKLTFNPVAGTWSLALFAFDSGVGSSISQPYYRFADKGITLQPSALTGNINVVFSDDVLKAAHVGTRIRYNKREILMTAVTDARNGTGTVMQDLGQTVNVIPGDGTGYLLNEAVEGFDSKAKGVLVGIAALAGSGLVMTANPNGSGLWDGGSTVTVSAGGAGYVSGSVGIVAHYHLPGSVRQSVVSTSVTVVAGAITGAIFPAIPSSSKPLAGDVTFTVSNKTLTVFMTDGLAGFYNGEDLVGTQTRSPIVSGPTLATPSAITLWDEQVFSDVRGYPGDVFERSGRLGFSDFPQIRDGIILSAPGFRNDFDVGEGNVQDAIFWRSGRGDERILYCVSSANLIVLTDRRVCYVPESEATALQATTFALLPISPNGASEAFPVTVEEGVIFIENGGNRVIGAAITGQVASPWAVTDLSRRASHQIKNPVSLAMTSGNPQSPERYVFALNTDGTLACMFYDKDPARLGWTPWDTAGTYVSMISLRGVVYAICQRTIGGVTVYLLEQLDADAQLDASTLFTDAGSHVSLLFDDGSEWMGDDGSMIVADERATPQWAGQTVAVIQGTQYLGTFTVDATGAISGLSVDGAFEAGLHFDINAVLWPPEAKGDTSQFFGRRRNNRVAVRVKDSCVYTVGIEGRTRLQTRPAYDQGDDITIAPPLRTELKRFVLTGYEHEPAIQILRPLPQPLTVISVVTQVTMR